MQVHLAQRTAFLKKTYDALSVIMKSIWGAAALVLGAVFADRLGWKSDELPWLLMAIAIALVICVCLALLIGVHKRFIGDTMTSDTP